MGVGTISLGAAAALAALSAAFLRRRISRSWIDLRSDPTELTADQVVIITGGNVGLGFEAALDLARRRARVVLACRNMEQGQAAVQTIKAQTGNEAVECLEVDLADLASVRRFATRVKSKYPKIYALVLNAGVWVPMDQGQKTKEGFEFHFGVNHLAHFELVRSLQDHMAQSKSESRIIFVASSLLKYGKVDFEKRDFVHQGRAAEEGADGKNKPSFTPTGYCDSKLMNALTCQHLATQLPPHISTYALCPGFCRSSLGRHVKFPWYKKVLIAPIFLLIQRTTTQGAQNIVFCTITDKEKLQSGSLYSDGEILSDGTDYIESLGSDAPRQLWELSEKLLKEIK